MFWGESESAFFKSAEVNPCRTLVKPFYPPTDLEYVEEKDINTEFEKVFNEIAKQMQTTIVKEEF